MTEEEEEKIVDKGVAKVMDELMRRGVARIEVPAELPKISSGLFIAQLHNETDITYSMVELAERLDCGVTSMQIDIPKRLVIDKIIFKEKTK